MDYANLKIPNHIAIILDGNGRWAKSRNKERSYGHKMGAQNLKKLSKYIFSKGIKVLSIYAFSTENFKRSEEEVNYLMNLFLREFKSILKYLEENKVKVVFSGREDKLPDEVIKEMRKIEEITKNNDKGIFNICVNYGGRAELIDTSIKIHKAILNNEIKIEEITEETFNKYLYYDLPPIDFLIRTSGEMRVSNFMLWQLSYAEFYFPNVHFPDFKEKEFDQAILEYTRRDRRFGGINYDKKIN